MKKKDKNTMKKAMEAVEAYVAVDSIKTDPNGSYTGVCDDKKEKPVQDADDL